MFPSRYMPCPECGASLERSETDHRCEPERQLDYVMFGLRDEIASLEPRFSTYLATPQGQFERWLAARDVRRTR